MAGKTHEHNLGYALVAVALFILWYLNKNGLLHESVVSSIVTPTGTVTSDPATGYPQFDPNTPSTVPANIAQAVAPIDKNGVITTAPADPTSITCPLGYTPWHNAADGTYWCMPK